ncbi:hypothetical protein NQZ68_012717 [Scomber scombrus]|uniref:Probable G-protein coupled receptor 34 n=1 Tax=Scomber scombrus TaxID=13677 RepID=A0AAV1P7V1_SCOSC
MEFTTHTSSPDNATLWSSAPLSHPSSVRYLCTTSTTHVFLPFAYALLFLTALPGNALSLWVFLRCISTISPTHIYLTHLSVSNLILSLTAPFLAAYYAWGSVWTLRNILCQLVLHGITPVLQINIYISLIILMWVALSRFAALIQHTHASSPSTCTTLLPHGFFTRLTKDSFASRVCAAVWLMVSGFIVPVTVYYSVNEAMRGSAVAQDGETEAEGRLEVCYNPAVEIGGGLSAVFTVAVTTFFFVCYLLVLLSYMIVLRHISHSHRNTTVTTSKSLLGRVLRNIVVIQVVFSVCLLPYHIFRPIFISLAHDQLTHSPDSSISEQCHPLSTFIEVKNCLLLLAALRGSTDPVMYFLLDKTFRHQTLKLLRCKRKNPETQQQFWAEDHYHDKKHLYHKCLPDCAFHHPFSQQLRHLTVTLDSCGNPNALQSPLAVLYSTIFVLGLVGNLVALWVFFCVHSKKNSVRVFLINVAFADLLLVVCLPFRILYHSQGNVWNLGPTFCKVVGNLFYMNMYMSITLLGLISVDRYLKIHHGARMQHRLRTTRWSKAICAFIWIMAICLTSVMLMSKNHKRTGWCFHYKSLLEAKWKAYVNIFLLVVFWLVFISLVVSYGMIALKLQRTSQEKPDLPNALRYSRTARKSFFILFLFTVSFVPYHMVRVFYIKHRSQTSCLWRDVADKANEVVLLFSALNSCLDPVMYFLLSSSVRKEVLRLEDTAKLHTDTADLTFGCEFFTLSVAAVNFMCGFQRYYQMEFTTHTSSPDNAALWSSAPLSHPSSVRYLCTTSATHVFLPFAYALLFLTALPGNALSLWVFLRSISTISPTHIYLTHLSVSNLILSLTAPFLAAYYAWGSVWTLRNILCQLVLHGITPVLQINIYISLIILMWVALSRFAALIQHTHASRQSSCTTLLPHGFFTRLTKDSFASRVCATVWLMALGFIVPVTVYYSVNEAMRGSAVAQDGEAEAEGRVEVCYNPAVEIGGGLSAGFAVAVTTFFFVCYLLVLLSYMIVLRHIRRSRSNTTVTTSQSLLGRVLRNIVVIQVVFSVCLLPYHIFRPIFISLAHDQLTHSPDSSISEQCHPLSTFIEVKNCLLLLAALRGSTDPVMYFLLDKTFRHQTLKLLRCKRKNPETQQQFWSVTGSGIQKVGQLDGNVAAATANSLFESAF